MVVLTYDDVAPLDWPQLKCLLWEGLELCADAPQWDRIAAFVNAKCRRSNSVPGEACHKVVETMAHAMPHLITSPYRRGGGQKAWVEMLYTQAQARFGRPRFMNLGFAAQDDRQLPISLNPEDEPYRYPIQLYHQLLVHTDCAGKRVLEVGCGSGGGLRYIADYLGPRSIVGVDAVASNFPHETEWVPGTASTMLLADAEDIPLASGSFDVLLSVESSEHYCDIPKFFAEAHRLLAPGGVFLLADLRWNGSLDSDWGTSRAAHGLVGQLQDAGFRIRRVDDITANVLRSIDLQDAAKRAWLDSAGLSGNNYAHFFEIMLCVGSRNYERMRNGELLYVSLVAEPSPPRAEAR